VSVEDRISLKLDEEMADTSDSDYDDYDIDLKQDIVEEEVEESIQGSDLALQLDELISNPDSIDFDAFDDDDVLNENENIFEALNISILSSDEEQTSVKTSRTGITVNPSSVFPHHILSYIQKWDHRSKLNRIMGLSAEYDSIADIAKIYLLSVRLSGVSPKNLFTRLTGSDHVELPCPLSDLVCIRHSLI